MAQPWVLQVWTKDIAGVLCWGADVLRALRRGRHDHHRPDRR